jgi:ferredoxin
VVDIREYSEFLEHGNLQNLIDTLKDQGYRCIGPVTKDGAIVYEDVDNVAQLPFGIHDVQQPGSYRLEEYDNRVNTNNVNTGRYFAWANGPQNLKPLLFLPREKIWSASKNADGSLGFEAAPVSAKPTAVLGVRACDAAALDLLDKHYLQPDNPDPLYQQRRKNLLLVGVNCTRPAATCFCVSTGDGPQVRKGVDIVLSELDNGFLVKALSDTGRAIVDQLPVQEAASTQWDQAIAELEQAADQQQRKVPLRNLHTYLMAKLEHPRWSDVASRCLSCGNCTSVCPTCFCHNQVEETALDGSRTDHYRQWDSCFSKGHSYIHGIVIREETVPRYRQWLTHKFGTWHVQYGRSGCVGCGRCITWCPVGIDVTEELAALTSGVVSA